MQLFGIQRVAERAVFCCKTARSECRKALFRKAIRPMLKTCPVNGVWQKACVGPAGPVGAVVHGGMAMFCPGHCLMSVRVRRMRYFKIMMMANYMNQQT